MFEFFKKKPQQQKSAFIDYLGTTTNSLSISSNYLELTKRGYIENPIVYRCINKIAESVALLQLKLFQYKNDGTKTEITKHPILDLLNKPNPLTSGNQLLQELFINKNISGEAFLYFDEDAQELWTIKPNEINVTLQQKPQALVYNYNNKNYFAFAEQDFECEIFHYKTYNPINKLRGLSPMLSAAKAITSFNDGLDWNKNLLTNGASPSGALKTKASLSTEQFQKLKAQLEEKFSGSRNSGKPLLLEGDMDWQQFSMTPKDMDFTNGLLENARFICTVYGVPSQLIGIRGESTYSNYEHALISFWQDTIAPQASNFVAALNAWLLDFYKEEGLSIEIDYSNIDGLEPRKKAKADRLAVSVGNGTISRNEARAELGYEDVEGGDELLVPSGAMPINDYTAEAEQDYTGALSELRTESATPAE